MSPTVSSIGTNGVACSGRRSTLLGHVDANWKGASAIIDPSGAKRELPEYGGNGGVCAVATVAPARLDNTSPTTGVNEEKRDAAFRKASS
mmetsp:Transcript_130958/g.326749  ORF Transcript_130958/g.326749 Transcript_130958/m.326749 type:complete len:90 (-) Transcript_130958:727-996(-)